MKRIVPAVGQESVWDYPRPPKVEPCSTRIRVEFEGVLIADSVKAYRLLEKSHPPTYYIPPGDVRGEFLKASARRTFCEFKGEASYWNLQVETRIQQDAVWSYPDPNAAYSALGHYLAFYANRVDACFVGDERVEAQAGDLYGGWITTNVVGPFKGGPGTWGW